MTTETRSPALGATLQSYGPNVRAIVIIFVLATFFCTVALLFARDLGDRTGWIVFYALLLSFGLLLWRYLVARVWLQESGISYHGFPSSGELRWAEIASMYFGSYQLHAYHFPLGTFYRLKLVDVHGHKVSLGESIRHADHLAGGIACFTRNLLLEKARHDFDSGLPLNFGAVRVQRQEGLTIDKNLFDKKIRWDEIKGYDFDSGYIRFHQLRGLSWKVPSERVANAHVLRALLDEFMPQFWRPSSPAYPHANR